MRFLGTAILLFAAFSNSSHAQGLPGSVRDGHAFAMEVCSECHVVAPGQDTPATDAVPTFTAVAADPAITELSLRVFLQTPHAQMPNFILSRPQTDNIVSYILSLRN
jgi:mono/diheme cytochrome c family protein